MAATWKPDDLPDQHGRTAVVTGANAGVGYFISEQLARAGARVVLACRSEERAAAAMSAIRGRVAGAELDYVHLDLAELGSVRSAAERIRGLDRVDLLVENAAVTLPTRARQVTSDGNELVLGVNFLGHFALTALALPALARTENSRIITMGSLITRLYDFRIGDLQLRAHYTPMRAYAHSKIAMQSFGLELDRRLRDAGSTVESLVAHPGYSVDSLSPRIEGVNEPGAGARFGGFFAGAMAQGKDRGAWPAVRAALDVNAVGGQYWGPRLLTQGRPVLGTPTHTSVDRDIAAELWQKAEEYTGQGFALTP
jgi:NAD(P)-dependent dehydrogenase (short-subunit alcohol dehydrogenase family)